MLIWRDLVYIVTSIWANFKMSTYIAWKQMKTSWLLPLVFDSNTFRICLSAVSLYGIPTYEVIHFYTCSRLSGQAWRLYLDQIYTSLPLQQSLVWQVMYDVLGV